MSKNRLYGRSAATAAALTAAIVLTGACASEDAAPTAGTGASAPVAAPTDSAAAPRDAAAGNSAQVCAAAEKASRDMIKAMAKGAGEGSPSEAYRKALAGLSGKLTAQVEKASDETLAAAVRQMATEAAKLSRSADPAEADGKAFEAAGKKLEDVCATTRPTSAPVADATVGADGSPCELPVSFAVPGSWKPKAVNADDAGVLGELVRRGPLTMVCEIDAKPAGLIGFVRVWSGATDDPRAALDTFLKDEKPRKPVFTDITVGGQPGVEVGFRIYDKILEETRQRRAFAVQTARGSVVVTLQGFDEDEFREMLPAYEGVKRSLTVNP